MKTTFKTLICALALGTTVAFAGPGSDAKKPTTFETGIYKNQDGHINVNIEKDAPASAIVQIVDANGKTLAQEGMSRKQSKAAYRFDVSALPDGEYTLEVKSNGEEEVTQFTITSEKAVVTRTLTLN